MNAKKTLVAACAAIAAAAGHGAYRQIGTSLEPNSWTCKIEGVLMQAAQTGIPILYIDVNSSTCGHCHTLNALTLSSAEFKGLERDIVFYQVMTDDVQISTMASASIYNRYSPYYYNGSGYPLVAVIAKDGSVYKSFDRTVTDERNIAADLKKAIEELSMIQLGKVLHTDGTETTADAPQSSSGDETPADATPSPFPSIAPAPSRPASLSGWIAALRGKANGVLFDAHANAIGSLALNITANGKVTVRRITASGRATFKAELGLDDNGRPSFSADGLSMSYDYDNGLWIGELNSGKAFAGKSGAKQLDGLYTLSANAINGGSGYLTLTAKNGKGRVAGMLNGRNKVSVNGNGVFLPANIVAENLPRWNLESDVAIYPIVNAAKKTCGALFAARDGTALGALGAVGMEWFASGEQWRASTSLAPLGGRTAKVGGYEIPVVAVSSSKITADVNPHSAKLQAIIRKGIFKGTIKVPGGRLRFEGVLIGAGNSLRGFGVSFGAGVYAVTLEMEDGECGECTVGN